MSAPVVVWFRRDLRLADNPALAAAVAEARADGAELLALFVLDPALWDASGAPRAAYLAGSLAALSDATGGRLLVRHGDPRRVLPEVVGATGARSVHVAATYEPYGARRDAEVEAALAGVRDTVARDVGKRPVGAGEVGTRSAGAGSVGGARSGGATLVRTGSAYAVAPGRIRTRGGEGFQVFTPFRDAWLAHGWRPPAPRPREIPWAVPSSGAAGPSGPALSSDGLPPTPVTGAHLPVPGESAAGERWQRFVRDHLRGYAAERERPDHPGTSRASIALKWGELHPRTLLADLHAAVLDDPSLSDDATRFRTELAWREFHADVLHHHPTATSRSLRAVVPDDSWARGSAEDDSLAAWAGGRTGYPLVDAGMRQLLGEGWMHNRVRMVVASFLVKDLHVRWQRGAAHFMAHLVDGDLPQNQLNWQWVAGTGRDAAPYFRIFNPVKQGLTFDPDGDYVRRWVPELRGVPGAAVHEPWKLGDGLDAASSTYPQRIVDHAVERKVALDDFARGRGA